jgi:hypothetical protein
MPEAQVFHHYAEWEDWKAGLYRCAVINEDTERAARMLANPEAFYMAAKMMLRDWPRAAEHNLTNREQNRRAWIGQATCCYSSNAPEGATRLAWWVLLADERDRANAVADRVIAEWEAARDTQTALFDTEAISA